MSSKDAYPRKKQRTGLAEPTHRYVNAAEVRQALRATDSAGIVKGE
jgi:hypothetical protein